MDESKIPYNFQLHPEMQNLQPLDLGNSPSYQVHNVTSSVQQQACQASSSQVPLRRTNGSFQGQRDTIEVRDENSGNPFRLSEQDFSSVGSCFSGQRNLLQPLKFGKSSNQALPVQQQEDTASSSQVNLPSTNESFQSQEDFLEVAPEELRSPFLDFFKLSLEVAPEELRSPFLDLFKLGLGRSSGQQVGIAASPVQQKGYHASSSRFQSKKDSLGVTYTKSKILFQLNEPDFPSLGSSYSSSGSRPRVSRLTKSINTPSVG